MTGRGSGSEAVLRGVWAVRCAVWGMRQLGLVSIFRNSGRGRLEGVGHCQSDELGGEFNRAMNYYSTDLGRKPLGF